MAARSPPFHEPHRGPDFGLHRALGEVPLGEVAPRLLHRHPVEGLLPRLLVVDPNPIHVGEDEEHVGPHVLGEPLPGEVLVDHRLDPAVGPVLLHHRDPASS